jgi:hypothetical protein
VVRFLPVGCSVLSHPALVFVVAFNTGSRFCQGWRVVGPDFAICALSVHQFSSPVGIRSNSICSCAWSPSSPSFPLLLRRLIALGRGRAVVSSRRDRRRILAFEVVHELGRIVRREVTVAFGVVYKSGQHIPWTRVHCALGFRPCYCFTCDSLVLMWAKRI